MSEIGKTVALMSVSFICFMVGVLWIGLNSNFYVALGVAIIVCSNEASRVILKDRHINVNTKNSNSR